MTTYTAKSLADIAAHFDEMEHRAMQRSVSAKRIKDKAALVAEARTWGQAAQIIRETTLTPIGIDPLSEALNMGDGTYRP